MFSLPMMFLALNFVLIAGALLFLCILGLNYAEWKTVTNIKRNARKLQGTIIGIEKQHHTHSEGEHCCGPDISYLLQVRSEDGLQFEKHLWEDEKAVMKNKKKITVYVSNDDPSKYHIDLQSAE